ncbi:MAG: AI-2E family transporter [Acidobacteriaceae bacterium]|nr:AI-2E family transporter [Acidobacteriaceae bacterium]
MLGIDERALRIVWTIFLFALLLGTIYLIRDTLLLFALAIFFAYMLSPVVGLVERLLPKRRTSALAVVYVVLIGLLVFIGFQIIPKIVEQATNLATRLPALLSGNKLASMPLPSWLEPVREHVIAFINRQASDLGSRVVPFIQQAGSKILSGIGALLPLILIPILAFFFLKDGEQIRGALIGTVDSKRDRTLLEQILDDIHVLLRNYIRALVLMSVSSFCCWFLFLSVMRYPYELLLAGIAGVLEFIPVIGPAAAVILMLIVYAVTGAGGLLWIVIFAAIYRLFADYVLNPYLMSAGIEIHPLLVLFGVLAGESMAGIPGMFFSVPVIAILRVLYVNLKRTYLRRQLTAGTAPPPPVNAAEDFLTSTGGQRPR